MYFSTVFSVFYLLMGVTLTWADLEYIGKSAEDTNNTDTASPEYINIEKKNFGANRTYFIQVSKSNKYEYDEDSHEKSGNKREDMTILNGKLFDGGNKERDVFIGLLNRPANLEMEITPPLVSLTQPRNVEITVSDPTMKFLDSEWSFQNNTNFEFPNISQEIYEAMLENNKHNTMKNASTVRCLFEASTNEEVLLFNTSHIRNRDDEILVEAELYVFTVKSNETTEKSQQKGNEQILRLYQVVENATETNASSFNADLHKLVSVLYIPYSYAGWQVFKVKSVVKNWFQGVENLGFLLTARDSSEKPLELNIQHRGVNGGKYQPTLILYYEKKNKKSDGDNYMSTLVDNTTSNGSRRSSKQRRLPHNGAPITRQHLKLLQKGVAPCGRHVWYVSFHSLGWNNFILSPHGFMAYKCKGSCLHPYSVAHYTNHGRLTQVESDERMEDGNGGGDGKEQQKENKGTAERVCCVPQRYRPIVLMFYDKFQNVVIKKYEEMIVEECGCR